MDTPIVECRNNNIKACRTILHCLYKMLPQYGPVFLEGSKFEEKCGNYENILASAKEGSTTTDIMLLCGFK